MEAGLSTSVARIERDRPWHPHQSVRDGGLCHWDWTEAGEREYAGGSVGASAFLFRWRNWQRISSRKRRITKGGGEMGRKREGGSKVFRVSRPSVCV